MAKYNSKYAELGFYVDEVHYEFKDGQFATEDKKVIDVLDKLADAERVEEPKATPKRAAAKK